MYSKISQELVKHHFFKSSSFKDNCGITLDTETGLSPLGNIPFFIKF